MAQSLINKTQLAPNISDLVSGYGQNFFYPLLSNPSGYVTSSSLSSTGVFATTGQLSGYYPRSNPSGYITGNLSLYTPLASFNSLSGSFAYLSGYVINNSLVTTLYLSSQNYASASSLSALSSSLNNSYSALALNVASTGSTLSNQILSLSGTLTGSIYSTSGALSGSINSLSGTLTSTYATITNLASTGSTLTSNLATTGSTLAGSINSLSGTLTSNYATNASVTSIVNSAVAVTVVLTTGDQFISGSKTFTTGVTITGNVNTLLNVTGLYSGYQQINIQNFSNSQGASSDFVATADFGNQNSGYVDLGINSSKYTGAYVGYTGDAYLYSLANDFYIGNANPNAKLYLFAGNTPYSGNQAGLTVFNNNFGINNSNPTFNLDVSGNTRFSGNINVSGTGIFAKNINVSGTGIFTYDLNVGGSGNFSSGVFSKGSPVITGNSTVTSIIGMGLSAYNALGAQINPATLYIITGA